MSPQERATQRKTQVVLAFATMIYLAVTALMSLWWGWPGTIMAAVLTVVVSCVHVLAVRLDVWPKDKELES